VTQEQIMIVRKLEDGSLILVNQTDHARLSGMFAAHWGNDRFAIPRIHDSSIRAATFHDHGWLRYEADPHYDPASKSTPSFFEVQTGEAELVGYGWAIDWLTEIDPYAGLLISRHRTGLYRDRYGAVHQPVSVSRKRNDPLLDEFVGRYEEAQRRALEHYPRAQFLVDYQLLQFWDLLSLALCLREPRAEPFAFVPSTYDGDGRTGETMTMTPLPNDEIELTPYPFDARGLQLGYAYRRLPASCMESAQTFRRAYFGATPKLKLFTFT
jgi:hypothetical protein